MVKVNRMMKKGLGLIWKGLVDRFEGGAWVWIVGLVGLVGVVMIGSRLTAYAQTGGGYDLTWWTVDGGGSTEVSGGSYTILSTIGQAEAQETISGGSYTIQSGFWPGEAQLSPPPPPTGVTYLPILLKSPAPDLIGSFTLMPNQSSYGAGEAVLITAIITNQGASIADSFWVDFYINPSKVPTVNERWDAICGLSPCQGLAWLIPGGLGAGQSMTLTSTPSSYAGPQSQWSGSFASGSSSLYLYVDSWNPGITTGGVAEGNESNNLFQHGQISAAGLGSSTGDVAPPQLPPRSVP